MFKTIQRLSQQRFGVKPLPDTMEQLEAWLQGSLGQELLAEEQEVVDALLNDSYGFHLMQLGISRKVDMTRASTINHRFAISPIDCGQINTQKDSVDGVSAKSAVPPFLSSQADLEKIPIESETIDVALLHHVLEFTANPHQLLRETARTVIPRGYIVVVGFNPVSWFGLFKKFGLVLTSKIQWRHHSLRLGRVTDWLRLLDFEPVAIKQGFHRWPIDHPKFMAETKWYERFAKRSRLSMGGFYVILARKDVVRLTPIKPSWKTFNPIESFVGARPSARVTDTAPSKKQMH